MIEFETKMPLRKIFPKVVLKASDRFCKKRFSRIRSAVALLKEFLSKKFVDVID